MKIAIISVILVGLAAAGPIANADNKLSARQNPACTACVNNCVNKYGDDGPEMVQLCIDAQCTVEVSCQFSRCS